MGRKTQGDHIRSTGLSERLLAVASMVTPGSVVCDVGCDHGYVPIYLVKHHVCPRVIAMDVNEGPLKSAGEHVREAGLLPYIETRLSDGVEALEPGESDCLIIAGMGGRLMERILTEGRERVAGMREVILQPQSEIAAFRKFLREQGYTLLSENMIFEDGKYYPMMKVATGNMQSVPTGKISDAPDAEELQWQQVYDRYGFLLLREKHPVLHQFLMWEEHHSREIMERLTGQQEAAGTDERRTQRLEQLRQEAKLRTMALSCYEE